MYKKYREDALSILPNFLCDRNELFVPPDELAGDAAQRRLPVGHSLHNHPVLAACAVPHGDAVFRQPLDLIVILAVDAERLEPVLAACAVPHGDAVFRQPLDLIVILAVDAERLEGLLAAVFHPFHIAENSGDDPDHARETSR